MNKIMKISLPIVAVALAIGVAFAVPKDTEVAPQPTVQAVVTVKDVEVTPEPVQEPVVEAPAPVAEQPVEVVTVQSNEYYANLYLDISTPQQKNAFDMIVQEFPDRFTEDVREANIKALSVWANVAATGIDKPDKHGLIYQYGANGAFFDSDLAKSRH